MFPRMTYLHSQGFKYYALCLHLAKWCVLLTIAEDNSHQELRQNLQILNTFYTHVETITIDDNS